MADLDLTPAEVTADERIPLYNVGPYDAVDNPYGFDEDGHRVNLMRMAGDLGIIGRMARRMAILVVGLKDDVLALKSDVIGIKALTAEDASNTYQDRLATAANLVVSAGHVSKAAQWAGAAQNVEVEPGKFSALHWAERAFAAAGSVNLPVAGAGDGLKFLQMKADGSGYQLATIATATAQQIADGTGTGFVNSQTLGPILDALEAANAAGAAVLPPVGSMLLLPKYANSPPESVWLPADGRIVSKVAFPELSAALPPIPEGFRGNYGLAVANPYIANVGLGGSDANSVVLAIAPNKITGLQAIIQYSYLRVYNSLLASVATVAVNFSDFIATDILGGTGNFRQMAIPFDTKLLYITDSGLKVANYSNGAITNVISGATGSTATYGFLHQLPNGNILAFFSRTTGTIACYRLLAGLDPAVPGNWNVITPAGFDVNASTLLSWTDKAGYLYITTRQGGIPANSPINVYRTLDGVTWQLVINSMVFESDPNVSHPGSRNTLSSLRLIDEGKYESADGQRIVVRIGFREFICSTNAGTTWTKLTASTIFSANFTYDSSSSLVTFVYDKWEDDFIFATYHTVSGANRFSAVRTSNFSAFVGVVNSFTGITGPASFNHEQTCMIALNGKRFIVFRYSGSNQVGYRTLVDPTTPGRSFVTDGSNANAAGYRLKVVGYPADDIILYSPAAYVIWIDPSEVPPLTIPNFNEYPYRHYQIVNGKGFIAVNANSALYVASLYTFNPDSEIKLPNIVHRFDSGSSGGQTFYTDAQRSVYVGFKHLIRVK